RSERHRWAAGWIESLGRPEDHAEMLAHHYGRALEYARAAVPMILISETACAADGRRTGHIAGGPCCGRRVLRTSHGAQPGGRPRALRAARGVWPRAILRQWCGDRAPHRSGEPVR